MNDNILKRALILTSEEMLLNEFADVEKLEFLASDTFLKRINKLSKKYDKITFKLTYTRVRKVVCVFVAILLIMLSSLSVSAVRDAISEFFVRHFSNHDVVEYNEDETIKIGYPDTIEEVYEIQNVPEGYELIDCSETETRVDTIYLSNNGQIVLQQVVKVQYQSYINNEGTSVTNKTINNVDYIVYENEHDITLVWDNGKYIFTITSDLKFDKLIEICENLKIKK